MRPRTTLLATSLAATLAAHARAQLVADPAHDTAWAENAGWTSWADAGDPAGAQCLLIDQAVLSGFVWSENVGWINLGDGMPANGVAYANTSGQDAGVNLSLADDRLGGLAWSENAGWINLAGGALASPPNPARLDRAAGRLRGFAWSENLGWINLDDASRFVAVLCLPDFNRDGFLDFFDYDDFVACFETGRCPPGATADFNRDGFADFFDYDAFVAAFEAGC